MKNSRVRERLEKLRERFPLVKSEQDGDKDFQHLTGTDLALLPQRSFFLGEMFWVLRAGWSGCGGFETNLSRDTHPGLVVKKQYDAFKPVDMVPGSKKEDNRPMNGNPAYLFSPRSELKWTNEKIEHPERQYFVLNYWRPVSRVHLSFYLGRLDYPDQMALQECMREAHGKAWQARAGDH